MTPHLQTAPAPPPLPFDLPRREERGLSAAELAEHRQTALELTEQLSGERALGEEEELVYVYRTPAPHLLRHMPRLAETRYGRLVAENGRVYAADGAGVQRRVIALQDDVTTALDFINAVQHLAVTRRQAVKAAIQQLFERSLETRAPAALTYTVQLYDDLLKQLEHEYFRQRDRRQQAAH